MLRSCWVSSTHLFSQQRLHVVCWDARRAEQCETVRVKVWCQGHGTQTVLGVLHHRGNAKIS